VKKNLSEGGWWRKHFPSVGARLQADKAVDRLDTSLPMTVFIDAWLAEYKRASGK
jgi:hypothetical protein